VAEYLADKPYHIPVTIMGIPDRILEHGTQRELHDEIGIGPDGIREKVKEIHQKLLAKV
jgi:1-deoxy-D-xylulose-5-phosphate synthase